MPHLALVPLTGFRVREAEMQELGMRLPGLQQRAAALAELPALGVLTLAGMTPEHWSRSHHAAAQADEALADQIAAQRPTLAAISALTASVQEAYRLSEMLRRRGILTVMGGLHVTAAPQEAETFCDAVVIGEGEPVWRRVLADAEAGKLSPRYQASEPSEEWPAPQWELLGGRPPRYTLQTQRGCPFACDFCAASRLLSPFREKPLADIDRELADICERSPRPLLELADDNTFAGTRDFLPFFERMKQSGARWFTESDWRIGERPQLLQGLAESGCRQVLVGIESLVFRYPGQGRKADQSQRIMDAIAAIQEAGVVVNGCFIAGADGETRSSLERLTRFILESPLAEVQLTLQTPFPGAGLYQRLRKAGRLLPDRDWSCYTLFDVCHQPDAMSVEELEAGFREALTEIYSAEATRKRVQLRRDVWRCSRISHP